LIGLLVCTAIAAAPPADVAVWHRKVVAKDGVALALYRYAPRVEAPRRPVLLIADFGLGRIALEPFARFLSSHGRVAYVAELRGQGKAAGVGWTAQQLVETDLPAIAAAIVERQFDVVAHGWAGTLVLAATVAELEGRVGKVVSLGTPAEFAVPSPLVEALLRSGGNLSTLGSDREGAKIFELLFAMNAKIGHDRLAWLRATAFSDLGAAGSACLLQWMRSGDLTLSTGESLKARLQRYDRPTIQFIGLADGWANSELCGTLREVSAAKVSVRVFSRFDYLAEDYSHLSLLQGEGAAKEVFRPALAFLDQELP
jgi:hypothetical protein